MPVWLWLPRLFRTGTLVGFLINLGFYGQLFVMSLYFQDVRGYSALRRDGLIVAGCAFLAGAALVSRDLTRR